MRHHSALAEQHHSSRSAVLEQQLARGTAAALEQHNSVSSCISRFPAQQRDSTEELHGKESLGCHVALNNFQAIVCLKL
jgi:hypothetical protein